MNASELISDLRKQNIEIVTEERLQQEVKDNPTPTTYIGYEPSSSLHIGNLSAGIPVLKLAKHGFRAIVLLADLHALANDKGDIDEIQEFARKDREMFEKVARKLGVGGKIEIQARHRV